MCGDCVEGLGVQGPGLPPRTVVHRGPWLLWLFPSFLWLVRCLCSQGEGQFKKKYGRRKTLPWHCSCMTSPYTAALPFSFFLSFSVFSCFMFSWQLSVSCADLKTGYAEEFTSSLILAMGSWPENTSSNFCLYWSSCVFPLLFLPPALQGFRRLFFSPSLLRAPQFSYFRQQSLQKKRVFIGRDPRLHPECSQISSPGLIRRNKVSCWT